MSLGMALTLLVMAVILLGASLYVFANVNNVYLTKKAAEEAKQKE